MDNILKVAKDIKSLKIQGAENVARAAAKALEKAKDKKRAARILAKSRPTEPGMRNAILFILNGHSANEVIGFLNESKDKIAKYGAAKIKNGMNIMTICHSSTVIRILKEAKKQAKKFTVHNTETRPLYQGRSTAKDLAKLRIPVRHYVDSCARKALKECDLFLFGADAITSEGYIINKIGTDIVAELADKYTIPVYCCTNSWKFDPITIQGIPEKIEQRSPGEIWKDPPRGVKIMNPAFSIVDPDFVSGIISELGVYRVQTFISQVQRKYSWMFK